MKRGIDKILGIICHKPLTLHKPQSASVGRRGHRKLCTRIGFDCTSPACDGNALLRPQRGHMSFC
jgi:hypothetical protein